MSNPIQPNIAIPEFIVFVGGEALIVGKEHLKAELVVRMHVDGGREVDYVAEHYGVSRAQIQAALDAAYKESWDSSSGTKADDLRRAIEKRSYSFPHLSDIPSHTSRNSSAMKPSAGQASAPFAT